MNNHKKKWTDNDAIEMMHSNTSEALRKIVETIKKGNHTKKEIIQLLIELSDTLEAQALTVSLRDEIGFQSPYGKPNFPFI